MIIIPLPSGLGLFEYPRLLGCASDLASFFDALSTVICILVLVLYTSLHVRSSLRLRYW